MNLSITEGLFECVINFFYVIFEIPSKEEAKVKVSSVINVALSVLGYDRRADGEHLVEDVEENNFAKINPGRIGDSLDFVTVRSW